MNANELRALADALEPMAQAPRFDGIDIPALCDYLRAQADAQPVAWRCEVRGDGTDPKLGAVDWRHYATTTNESNVRAFLSRCGDGIEGRAVPLYPHPAPAAPQAEPIADSNADYWLRNRQPILDAIERAGFMLMSNASGFWLHPRGTTDAQAEPLSDERIAEIQRAAYERAAQECIETAAELRRCADGCTDGRYDWKADGADDCADAIRALAAKEQK